MLIVRMLLPALLALAIAPSAACGQQISARWVSVQLHRVPTTRLDSARYMTSPLTVKTDSSGTIVVRYTLDNPCRDSVQIGVRERPARTLGLRALGNWQDLKVCPAVVSLETYVGTVHGLRAGNWRVTATTLVPGQKLGPLKIE